MRSKIMTIKTNMRRREDWVNILPMYVSADVGCIVLYQVDYILYYIVLYCMVLYSTVVYCIVLYCNVVYYTVWHYLV